MADTTPTTMPTSDSTPAAKEEAWNDTSKDIPENNLLDMAEEGVAAVDSVGESSAVIADGTATSLITTTTAQQPQQQNGGTSSPTKAKASAGDKRIQELEEELAASRAMVNALKQSRGYSDDDASLLMELQRKLQKEMASKAETEHKLRNAHKQIADLHTFGQEQTSEFEKYRGLEQTLAETLQAKDEAEQSLSMALERIESLAKEQLEHQEKMEQLQYDLVSCREAMAGQEQELQKIREQRDDQERREMSLTNRLNQAKKKEAGKTNEAEKYEEELTTVLVELEKNKHLAEELQRTKERLQKELEETIVSSRHRQVQTETALADERRLNEERKQKMKIFIEKKSEEIRQAKEDNDGLQSELNQTTRSLSELNIRWKQLHAQWVQSQTRNRELQRDLHRIKKDSETLHKVGDTLEMKLSRSATETEEHKIKRLAAKTELMTILKTLEAEREVTARLRDSIKFTFTPKALSQQQLLTESVSDFETQLVKLSIRLRKPLPPPPPPTGGSGMSSTQDSDGIGNVINDHDNNNDDGGWCIETMQDLDPDQSPETSKSDLDTHRLIEKLNRETQQVSKCIMEFVASIERMHVLLDSSGDRTCYAVWNEIIGTSTSTTGHHHVVPNHDNTIHNPETSRLHAITSRHYHD